VIVRSGLRLLDLDKAYRRAGNELAIEGDVYGVHAVFLELQTLEVHDEVAGEEGYAFGKGYLEVTNDGHALLVQSYAVFVCDGDAQLVIAAVLSLEAEAQSKGASGVNDRELAGEESIESALHAELTLIVGSVVAKDSNLNIHSMC